MPVAKVSNISKNSAWLLWHITEDLETLKSQVLLTPFEREELKNISHPIKKRELLAGKMAAKLIVEHLGEQYHGIFKDEFGKPFLQNHQWNISISHSFPYASIIVNTLNPVGIDIEKPQSKIKRISRKFLSEDELQACQNDEITLCTFWAAKEALYKLHGRKSLLFKENLKIMKNKHSETLIGEINLLESREKLNLIVEKINGYIICYTL